ncbi:MAG TPA: hypothetical protein IGR64_03560 [Leptolyngbyaceae cyanobacterium M65_K2018_010]|nr:hypothetical protein [Leptolyngbyaceae cyanobacterium M65_K2018_010]
MIANPVMANLQNPGWLEAFARDCQSGNESLDHRLRVDQMLSLIDGILPLEACLFHQILPLSIEGSHLNLGMVNPADQAALDYVRRQVSYIQCSVVSCPIDSAWHQRMLSNYLSYAAERKAQSAQEGAEQSREEHTAATAASQITHPGDRPTFIVDSPEEITLNHRSARGLTGEQPPLQAQVASPAKSSPAQNQEVDADRLPPLQLEVQEPEVADSWEDLGRLPPKPLMAALLHRVLSEGIGRLYLERQRTGGRVLYSQNGMVRSVLSDLNLDIFQGVINELKRLTHLPLLPTRTPQQVEIERLYRQERVLIRLRLFQGPQGEEATLQVLRGAALRFYQQQQIEQLGQDALKIAQNLRTRITAMRTQAQNPLKPEANSTATLLAINTLLKDIERQIAPLIQAAQNSDRSQDP